MTRRPHRPRRWTARRIGAVVTVAAVAATGFGGQASGGVITGPGTAVPAPAPAVEPMTTAPPPTTAAPRPVPDDVLADPGVAPGACEVITYTPAGAGEAKVGEMCRPAANQRDVAVVIVHGGSGISGGWEGMRRWADRYRSEGYVTFTPGYHLFVPGGARPVFPKPEEHIKAAVQRLRGSARALGIKPWQIVVQGQSAGARVGAVAFTTPDDDWFSGPSRHPGISDRVDAFIGFYHPYDATMQYADQYFGGGEASRDPAVLERYAKADSLALADDASGPALFVTGGRDWELIRTQQEAFAAALSRRSLLGRSVVIDGGGHGFDEGGPRLSRLGEQAAVHTLTFLNDVFPQTPARPAQSAPVDLSGAPDGRGDAPTTVPTRKRSTTATTRYRTSSSRPGSGSGSGQKPGVTAPSTAPPTTSATRSAPPTTAPRVTTKATTASGAGAQPIG